MEIVRYEAIERSKEVPLAKCDRLHYVSTPLYSRDIVKFAWRKLHKNGVAEKTPDGNIENVFSIA